MFRGRNTVEKYGGQLYPTAHSRILDNSIQLFIAGFLANKKAAENQRLHYSWF